MRNFLAPKGNGFSSEEINLQLLDVCFNCPDPVRAMDIVAEAGGLVTAEQYIDAMLACAPRDVATVPESELPRSHPFRRMKLE